MFRCSPLWLLVLASCGATPAVSTQQGTEPPATASASATTQTAPQAPLAPEDDEQAQYPMPRPIAEHNRLHLPYNEPLPAAAIARLGSTKLHSGFNVVAAGSDDSFVSAAGYHVGLQKWDAKTGALMATASLPKESYINVVATTKDRKLGAFASHRDVILVDMVTLKTKGVLEIFHDDRGDRIKDVAFQDDGSLLVAACSKNPAQALRVFDQQGKQLSSFDVPRPKETYQEACAGPVALAKGLLAVGINNKAQLISLKTKQVVGTFEAGVSVEAIALSPDGSQVLVGGYASVVNAFDVKTNKAVRSYGFFDYDHDHQISGITFSLDGKSVAISAYSGARIYDAASGLERVRIGSGVDGAVNMRHSMATIGNTLAFPVGSPDLIGRFDWTTGEQLTPHDLGRHDKELRFGAFGKDGSVFTSSRDGTIRKWDATSGAPIATFSEYSFDAPIGIAKDGTLLSVGAMTRGAGGAPRPSCDLRLHDPATLALRERISLDEKLDPDLCVATDLQLSADGTIAYLHFRGRLVALDLGTKSKLADVRLEPHMAVVSVLSDGSLALRENAGWVVLDGRTLARRRVIEAPYERIAASPTAMLGAALQGDAKLAILSLSDGKELHAVAPPKEMTFWQAMTFSPDGAIVYAGVRGGDRSGVISIDVKTGKVVGVQGKLHDRSLPTTLFLVASSDGKRLLEGNQDQTGLVLDALLLRGKN